MSQLQLLQQMTLVCQQMESGMNWNHGSDAIWFDNNLSIEDFQEVYKHSNLNKGVKLIRKGNY